MPCTVAPEFAFVTVPVITPDAGRAKFTLLVIAPAVTATPVTVVFRYPAS